MSKTSNKIRRFALFGLAAAMATGVTTVAPPVHADEVAAKVLGTPQAKYVNVRSTADTTTDKNIIDTINSGSLVWPICWISGSSVPSPIAGQPASTIWYKIPGYPNGWVSNSYLDTGSNDPVVPMCGPDGHPNSDKRFTAYVAGRAIKVKKPPTNPIWLDISYLPGGSVPGATSADIAVPETLYSHYHKNIGDDGADAYIDWSFFVDYRSFLEVAYRIPVGGMGGFDPEKTHGEWYSRTVAVGKFDIYRLSSSCYLIYDYYDFEKAGKYKKEHQAAETGNAMEFNVFSIGDLPNAPVEGGSDGSGIAGGQAKTCKDLGLSNGGGGW